MDIARALAYMHNKCVIHRDLKPSNILLTASGRVKVSIFKPTEETGTSRYMAPEVIRNEEYNSSVDIYSFGLILYTLCESLKTIPKFRRLKKRHPLKMLIEDCWSSIPNLRPSAMDVIESLELTYFNKCCG